MLAVIMPASATYYTVAPVIDRGATIYIGEEGLNLTHALNRAGGLEGAAVDEVVPTNWTIGWWAWSNFALSNPSKTLNVSARYQNFTVAPADFVGYTGYWYLVDPATHGAIIGSDGLPRVVFMVNQPYLDIRIWDFDGDRDVSGKSTPRGNSIGFRIDTNMNSALNSNYRSPVYNATGDGYINIKVRNESWILLTQLTDSSNTPHNLFQQNVSSSLWTWGDPANPASPYPWATGVEDAGGQPLYPVGTYTVMAESLLNNMKENYKQGGADYTGKTVSQAYTVSLVSESFNIQVNSDSVARGSRFSVIIVGNPKTAYYLWVANTSTMTGAPGDQPPTILVSAPIYQDPYEGPYTIGAHSILGGGGKSILEEVPPSTENVSQNEYYAKVVTSSSGTAIVEFRTSPDTKPGTYALRVDGDAISDEAPAVVVSEILPVLTGQDTGNAVIYHPRINHDIPAPVNNDLKRISRGGTVFIGEEGLNISEALAEADALAVPAPSPQGSLVGWWVGGDITTTNPAKTIDLTGRESRFYVTTSDLIHSYLGNWYLVNTSTGMAAVDNSGSSILVFKLQDPSLSLRIWDLDIDADVTGKSVPQGERLTFRVDTNMYSALNSGYRPDITDNTPGIINIKVYNERAARFNYLYQNNTSAYSLLDLRVDTQPWFWGGGGSNPFLGGYWGTNLLDRDLYYFYPVGTYTVCAESILNKMKDNYKQGGADYTGKTVSQCNTITIVPDQVKIEANEDVVTRGKPFSVTISGKPGAVYYLWLKDTSDLIGGANNQPPMITLSQEGVYLDSPTDPAFPIGSYQYETGGGETIKMNVGTDPVYNGTRYYSKIFTSVNGIRTIQFETDSQTRNKTYTLRVENLTGGRYKIDEVNITVEKGTPVANIGVFSNGTWSLDFNGNGIWDGTVADRYSRFGNTGDAPASGDWNTDDITEIGVLRNGQDWYLDLNGNGRWDGTAADRHYKFGSSGDIPVSGDWNNDGKTEVGVFRPLIHKFYLDKSGDGKWGPGDALYSFGNTGDLPLAGDWNSDKKTEIGVFRPSTHKFYLDANGNGAWGSGDSLYTFGNSGDKPVGGNWGY